MPIFLHDLLQHSFLQYAVLAGLLAAISCGIVGSYVVIRRTSYIAGAIAHCVLGGMGAARYLQTTRGINWLTPLWGATIAAVIAGVIITFVGNGEKKRQDTILSAIWSIGMALGISFIAATPGYQQDLMSFLFGNILMVTPGDLEMMAVLDGFIILVTILFYNKFLTISFQPQLARLRGLNTTFYNLLLTITTALTVVLLTQIVGLIMVIALLTLPTAIAAICTRKLPVMMLLSCIFCLTLTTAGLGISYAPELPAGATIIELAGASYILAAIFKYIKSRRSKIS